MNYEGKRVMAHVLITVDNIQIAHMSTNIYGGRHEFTLSQPVKVDGRHLEGFSLELWLDRTARTVTYNEFLANRPYLLR
jgi:hypothetical protein